MPKLAEMLPSKFLKQADVPQPALVYLTRISKEQVNQENEPEEHKWVAHFREFDRPLVLNTTNLNALSLIFNSEDSDDWRGECVIYTDPNVSFGGKLVGGLRLRKAKNQAARAEGSQPARSAPEKMAEVAAREQAKKPAPIEELEDDIPF
jgi:hypothetical protein